MTMTFDSSISKRISMLRTLLILSVVVLHVFGSLPADRIDFSDVPMLLRSIFIDRAGRFAVPTLSMISAYLLFRSRLDQAPIRLYKKKFKTLVVPFLVFNVAYVGIQYAIEYGTGWAPLYGLTTVNQTALLMDFTSFSGYPLNGPLHFLRDLFALALLAPLFGLFIRNAPWIGFALVCAIFLLDIDGHLVNRNTMAVLFYVGGMAAARQWNVQRYDRFAIPAGMALVAICIAAVIGRVESNTIVYLVSPPLVWIASSRLVGTRLGNWAVANSKYSFFVFLMHAPVIRVMELAHAKYYPQAPLLPAACAATAVILISLRIAYDAGSRWMPRTFNAMIGARVRPVPDTVAVPAFVERRKAPRTADAPVYTDAFRKAILHALNEARLAAVESHDLGQAASLQR